MTDRDDSFFANSTNDADQTSEDQLGAEDVSAPLTDEARLGAIMAYIPFVCFIPLLNMRNNEAVRFHARQGLVLFFIEILAALFIIDAIADFVFTLILLAALALAVAGIYFALQGKTYKLPGIAELAEKLKV